MTPHSAGEATLSRDSFPTRRDTTRVACSRIAERGPLWDASRIALSSALRCKQADCEASEALPHANGCRRLQLGGLQQDKQSLPQLRSPLLVEGSGRNHPAAIFR